MTSLRRILGLFIILFTIQESISQTISGTVHDVESQNPISNVFVFFDNSSIGTVTNDEGRFELELGDSDFEKIVFSHLNYDLLELTVRDILPKRMTTFSLIPKDIILEEAIVKARAKPRLRTRAFKRFRNAFVGDLSTKQVKIENPEVLLFERSGDSFLATANSPIIISNYLLGYKMTFFLDQFTMKDEDWVDYSGQVFFEEIIADKKATSKFKRHRKKIFQRSSRRFFQDLAGKEFSALDYKIAYSELDKEKDQFSNLQQVDSLSIKRQSDHEYVLVGDRCLTIIDMNTVAKHKVTNAKSGKLGQKTFQEASVIEAVSHLKPRGSKITFNRFGRILNSSEVEEYGYWAGLRVGSLLPLDYDP